MNRNPKMSYMQLLETIRELLKGKYAQIVQLSSSHRKLIHSYIDCVVTDWLAIDTDLEFIAWFKISWSSS